MRKFIIQTSALIFFTLIGLNVMSWWQVHNMEPYPTFGCTTQTSWVDGQGFVTENKECHRTN